LNISKEVQTLFQIFLPENFYGVDNNAKKEKKTKPFLRLLSQKQKL
jgi:hypothetical protein